MLRWTTAPIPLQSRIFRAVFFNIWFLGKDCQLPRAYGFWEKPLLYHSAPSWYQNRSHIGQGLVHNVTQQSTDSNEHADSDLDKMSNQWSQDLQSEAARYSILDVASLDFESSVGDREGRDSRLVERPQYQSDYGLWAILLHYRMRTYGDAGIKTIWKFITRRDRVRLLPTHWPMEDSLWGVFVSLGLRDHEFLTSIGKHASRLWRERKMRRPSLYVEVIGGLLRTENSAAAPIFSEIMHPGTPVTSEELLELFVQACKSASPMALEHFCRISESVQRHKIYGQAIPMLCEQERVVEAMALHSHLIYRHDRPASFEEVEPLVRLIARHHYDLSVFTRQLEGMGLSFSAQIQRLLDSLKISYFGMSQEEIDLATNETFGVRRSKISDAFAARFFATQSFSFDFVLNGLQMLGLVELGPLSLREIALGAGTAALLRHRLAKLDSIGIDTGGSAYSRVIRTLVRERQDSLLMDVVHCDQHPDVFEDHDIQSKLFHKYYMAKDWQQFNRTLAALTAWERCSQNTANPMLRSALLRHDWREVTRITTRMHQEHAYIVPSNIILMYQVILRPRGKSQVHFRYRHFRDLVFLITLWQKGLESGSYIPPFAWREPLRRLGMMGRWHELEKACFWLSSFYCPPSPCPEDFHSPHTSLLVGLSSTRRDRSTRIEEILTPELQRGVVQWGFIAGLTGGTVTPTVGAAGIEKSRILREAPGICGIELLCNLRRRYGVRLHEDAIRRGCLERLRQLFSLVGRSRLQRNREAKAANRVKLEFYVRWINELYGKPLVDMTDVRTRFYIYMGGRRWRGYPYVIRSVGGQYQAFRKDRNGHLTPVDVSEIQDV